MRQVSCLDWPYSYAQLCTQVVPHELIDQITHVADQLAECPNFWVPMADLNENQDCCRFPPEAAIQLLYKAVIEQQLQTQCGILSGAEWWVQIYKDGQGLDFHFDKDEMLFKDSQVMKQPVLSSVLYLYGDHLHDRLGPTVIVDQQFDPQHLCAKPSVPHRSLLVFPLKAAYLVFDGSLAHGVLSSFGSGRRATMLINWWKEKPQGIDRMSETQAKSMYVSSFKPLDNNTTANMPDGCLPELQPLPVLKLPEALDLPILVDDVLRDQGIDLTGLQAVHCLAFEHNGYHLYPLDDEQAGLSEKPHVAAAFVPVSGSDDEDCVSAHKCS